MKLWLSGEIEADVELAYRIARKEVEATFNHAISAVDYGPEINKWALIAIILTPRAQAALGYEEITKFHRRRKVFEARLAIPHEEFLSASEKARRRLITAMILRSVAVAATVVPPGFRLSLLTDNFARIALENGWTGSQSE